MLHTLTHEGWNVTIVIHPRTRGWQYQVEGRAVRRHAHPRPWAEPSELLAEATHMALSEVRRAVKLQGPRL